MPFYIETLVFLGFAIDEHIGYLSGVRVTQSLILCVCFVDRCLSFLPLCCLFFALRLLITPLVSSNSCQNLRTDNRVMSDELVLKRVFQIYYVLYINRSRIRIRNFVNDVAAKDFSVKIFRCNLTTNYYQSNFAFQNKSFVKL